MKRIQKFVAVNVIAALLGAGIPAMAAERGQSIYSQAGAHYQPAQHRGNYDWHDSRNRGDRNADRWDRDRRAYDSQDHDRGYRDERGYGYTSGPLYGEPGYDGYYHRTHDGRTAAIIGGSVAAGALIGAAAGHGQGAAIGAVIGGIAGAASAAADHHDRY